MAKKEVRKAKKMIHKKKKWSVAASVMGYHGGYDSKKGLFGGKGSIKTDTVQGVSNARALPVSTSAVFRPWYKRVQLKAGPGNKSGASLAVCGLQKIGTFGTITSSGTNQAFVIGGSRVSSFLITPDGIGGQMALDARNYVYYKFASIKFIAVMSAPFTDTLNVIMGYIPDSAVSTFQTITPDTLAQNRDFVDFTRKSGGPVVFQIDELNSQFPWYNTELDTSTNLTTRASCQGIMFGFFNGSDTSATTNYGELYIQYELILKDRAPDYGFTIQIRDMELAEMLFRALPLYREKAKKKWIARERMNLQLDEKEEMKIDDAVLKPWLNYNIVKSYDSTMRQLRSFLYPNLPKTGSGPGSVARVEIMGPIIAGSGTNPRDGITGDYIQNMNVEIGANAPATFLCDPRTQMIATIGGSGTSGTLQTNITDVSGTDLLNVNGNGTADINVSSVAGVGVSNGVIKTTVFNAAGTQSVAVSTNSSLQTVVATAMSSSDAKCGASSSSDSESDGQVVVVKRRSKSAGVKERDQKRAVRLSATGLQKEKQNVGPVLVIDPAVKIK